MLALRAIVVALPLSTAACLPMFGIAAAPVGAIGTTVISGKTPVDHVVSAVLGKDCSVRRNMQGLTYCIEDEQPPPVRVVCYHTLGDVNCYDRTDLPATQQGQAVEDEGTTRSPGEGRPARPVPPAVPVRLQAPPPAADGGAAPAGGAPQDLTPQDLTPQDLTPQDLTLVPIDAVG